MRTVLRYGAPARRSGGATTRARLAGGRRWRRGRGSAAGRAIAVNGDVRVENRKLTRQLWLMAAGAFGFGFALIPLYDVMCDITGHGASLSNSNGPTHRSPRSRAIIQHQ